jgi:hypothetical protein
MGKSAKLPLVMEIVQAALAAKQGKKNKTGA